MRPGQAAAYAHWLSKLPPQVQALAAEFPPGTVYEIEGDEWFVFGWGEHDTVLLTPVSPSKDYQRANAEKVHVCAQHLREGRVLQ
jgi:hypothetical protein